MLALLTFASVALAGSLKLEVQPDDVVAQRLAWAVYNGQTYVGMARMDGMSEDDGGATLVIRYTPVGATQPQWAQGVTVDKDGELVKVVHREGRRIRVLTVEGDTLLDEVRDGGLDGTLLSEREHALPEGVLSSPWLVPVALAGARGGKGDTWTATLVDGQVVAPEDATVTWQGRSDVGGKRQGDLAMLSRDSASWVVVLGEDGLAAIQTGGELQWVVAPRAEIEATHAQASAARR